MLNKQLWAAVEQDNRNLCRIFVNDGADPNQPNKDKGLSPLLYALANAKLEALQGMLESRQFKFTRDNPQAFAWSVAQAIHSFSGYVTILLSAPRDAEVSLADYKPFAGYSTPLKTLVDRLIRVAYPKNLASLLVQHGDDPNLIIPGYPNTALEYALQTNPVSSAVWGIVESSGFVFKIGVTEKALTMAIKTNTEVAELLLKHRRKSVERLRAESSEELDKVTLDEQLWAAVEHNNQNLCKLLVNQGADPNKRIGYRSPLRHALWNSQGWAVTGMLQSPQFKFTKNNPEELAWSVAQAIQTQPHYVTILLSAPREKEVSLADYEKSVYYSPPLKCLIEMVNFVSNARKLASLLVQHGDDPNLIIAGQGQTALEMSIASAAWNVTWGIVESPAFVFKIDVTDKAVRMAVNANAVGISEILIKLRQEAVGLKTPVSIHTMQKLYSEARYFEFHEELKQLDHTDPLKIIMLAMNNGYPDLVLYFIKTYFRDSPVDLSSLFWPAIEKRYVEVVRVLLERKVNQKQVYDLTDRDKGSPLLHAVKTSRDNSIIPALLIFSKQFTFNDQALEALHLAIDAGKKRIAVQLLAKYGDSKKSLDMALFKASLMGLSPVVARLLELGANPNMEDRVGHDSRTPLWVSCVKEDPETQELLLKAGANVNYGYQWTIGNTLHASTLLSNALQNDKVDSVVRFISHEKFTFDRNSCPVLLIALKNGQMQVFDLLLEKHTVIELNLDHFSYHGDKAIHIAVKSDNIPAVRSLLIRGSNPLVRFPNSNDSALMLAANKPEVFELLVSLGQFEFDEHCVEVVLQCIEHNQPALALSLLSAHPPVATISLDRCFAPAQKKGYFEITELLIRHGVSLPPQYAMTTAFDDPNTAAAYWSKAPCKRERVKALKDSYSYKNTVHSTYVENSQEIMQLWDAKNPPEAVQKPKVLPNKKPENTKVTFKYDSSRQNCVEFDMVKEVDYGETAGRSFEPGL